MDKYYELYHSLPSNRKIMYPLIMLFIFLFFSRLFINLNHIFSLLFTVIIIAWIMTGDSFNQLHEATKESVQKDYLDGMIYADNYDSINDDHIIRPPIFGSHLVDDPKIMDYYYRLKDYANYNLPSYRKSLLNSNNLLGIENFINHLDHAIKKPHQLLEQAETEYKEALNNMHSVIYSIPSTRFTNYTFNNSLQNLELILIQHLDNIKNLAKLKFDVCEISTESKPIHDYFAEPNDQKSKGYSMNFSMY